MKTSIKKTDRPRTDKDGITLQETTGLVALVIILFLWLRTFRRPKRMPTRYIDERGYIVLSDGNEYEHRYIARQILGRDLKQNEIVHHINGQKTDNRIWNLCLMDKEKHEHFHSWLRWKKEKSGRYPSIYDQKRTLEEEYGGILIEKLQSANH